MKILFLGIDLNRNDLLKNFLLLKGRADCYFLENFSPAEVKSSLAAEIGQVIFWKDYRDAFELLEAIRPERIVYALIDNYYHFALFFAARQKKIPIIYIDHGIRFEEEAQQVYGMEGKKPFHLDINKSYPKALLAYYKHSFFRKTLKKLEPGQRSILRKLFIDRTILDYGRFMVRDGQYIQPDEFIIYSEETWKYHKFLFGFEQQMPRIKYTGIPSLDVFVGMNNPPFADKPPGVLFIDQPLHEQNLLGWKREGKIKFLRKLSEITSARGYRLYVKPHPWNEDIYDEVKSGGCVFDIMREMDYHFIQKNIRVVVGFNSTLLIGFCALENFLTVCILDHPVIFSPSISQGIVKYHVAVEIHKISELDEVLRNNTFYLKEKRSHLPEFHSGMMFTFDGQSLQRTINYLVQ